MIELPADGRTSSSRRPCGGRPAAMAAANRGRGKSVTAGVSGLPCHRDRARNPAEGGGDGISRYEIFVRSITIYSNFIRLNRNH